MKKGLQVEEVAEFGKQPVCQSEQKTLHESRESSCMCAATFAALHGMRTIFASSGEKRNVKMESFSTSSFDS